VRRCEVLQDKLGLWNVLEENAYGWHIGGSFKTRAPFDFQAVVPLSGVWDLLHVQELQGRLRLAEDG
jgi:hypothetical protein